MDVGAEDGSKKMVQRSEGGRILIGHGCENKAMMVKADQVVIVDQFASR